MLILTVLIGPPGSGKSTWARRAGGSHLASDDVRIALVGDLQDHSRDDEVARAFDRAVLAAIRAGGAVVVENGANDRRDAYRLAARAAGVPTRVVVFENWDEARARAAARAMPTLTSDGWESLAQAARAAAAAVDGEGWDEVVRLGAGAGAQTDGDAADNGDAAGGGPEAGGGATDGGPSAADNRDGAARPA